MMDMMQTPDSDSKPSRYWPRWMRSAAGACALALALLAPACNRGAAPAARTDGGAVPVVVATVEEKAIPRQLPAIGSVEAMSTVEIRTQVGGEITRVHFQEGQDVRAGDLLFQLDSRPYQASLAQARATLDKNAALLQQAQANLARDTSQSENADRDERRYAELVQTGSVSKSEYDKFHTQAESLRAAVQSDAAAVEVAKREIGVARANVESACIELAYCTLRSPISGRTGNLLIHAGNVVKANDLPLVTIKQMDPIYVRFSLPERHLSEIQRAQAEKPLRVTVEIPHDEIDPPTGELTFIDNQVDRTTGMIEFKATVGNADGRLWPGQFVNVNLILGVHTGAAVVPSQAIQSGQAGNFVYVVAPDQKAELRPVEVGDEVNGDVVVEKGVSAGETVVVDGQLRLAPGAMVRTLPAQAAALPQSASGEPRS